MAQQTYAQKQTSASNATEAIVSEAEALMDATTQEQDSKRLTRRASGILSRLNGV